MRKETGCQEALDRKSPMSPATDCVARTDQQHSARAFAGTPKHGICDHKFFKNYCTEFLQYSRLEFGLMATSWARTHTFAIHFVTPVTFPVSRTSPASRLHQTALFSSHLPVERLPGVVRKTSVVPAFDHYILRVFWQFVCSLLQLLLRTVSTFGCRGAKWQKMDGKAVERAVREIVGLNDTNPVHRRSWRGGLHTQLVWPLVFLFVCLYKAYLLFSRKNTRRRTDADKARVLYAYLCARDVVRKSC